MKTAGFALLMSLASASALAQRPSDPALLVPQNAPAMDYVAITDPATGSIRWIDPQWFTAVDFAVLAHTPHIHLCMQPRTWLRRQQMEWITLRLAAAQPFRRFEPHWVTRAILVSEPGDRLGEDLDTA